jgi:hypothetical protein
MTTERITVSNCARCGGDHENISCMKLARPCGNFTHWAQCPTTLEPIMVAFVDDGEVEL